MRLRAVVKAVDSPSFRERKKRGLSPGGTLAIETSCDETSVAFIRDKRVERQWISSQIALHRPYHGVVPELASRAHLDNLPVLMRRLFRDVGRAEVERIAVTQGPGLVGALLVGVAYAKGLALNLDVPLVPINHIEAHLYSPFIGAPIPREFLGLVVSGSHSSLYHVKGRAVTRLCRTRDDAAGEAYDKVAKLFGLPYPGGPEIDRLAPKGDPKAVALPFPKMSDGSMDLSFSGIKSRISFMVQEGFPVRKRGRLTPDAVNLLASFQETVVKILVGRLDHFHRLHPVRNISISGGVAANRRLRERVTAWAAGRNVTAHFPSREHITDNAGMIGFLAEARHKKSVRPGSVDAVPDLEI
jgi:N6-L-threonylcarbamoyladenine synthase